MRKQKGRSSIAGLDCSSSGWLPGSSSLARAGRPSLPRWLRPCHWEVELGVLDLSVLEDFVQRYLQWIGPVTGLDALAGFPFQEYPYKGAPGGHYSGLPQYALIGLEDIRDTRHGLALVDDLLSHGPEQMLAPFLMLQVRHQASGLEDDAPALQCIFQEVLFGRAGLDSCFLHRLSSDHFP